MTDQRSMGNGDRHQLLTPQQVCEMLQIKPPRIYEMVKDRRLKAVKVGRLLRFRIQDVEAFIERSTTAR